MQARVLFAVSFLVMLSVAAQAQPSGEAKPDAKPDAAAGVDDPVVARIDKTEIHRSEVMAAMSRLPAQARNTPPNQLVPMMVEAVINTRLVQAAADKAGLDNDPEVVQRLAAAKADLVRAVYLERLVEKDMTDAKLKERYEADIKDTPAPEEINARHILVKTEDEAKAIVAQLAKGADFAKLAAEKSIDPAGKDSGGDLGWFTKDQMVPEFANAAFALKKDEYTKTPIKTRFGWHVIKLVDRRTAAPPSFDDLKTQLAAQVQNDIIAAKIKELRATVKIEILGPDGKPLPAALEPEKPAQSPAKPQITPLPQPKKP